MTTQRRPRPQRRARIPAGTRSAIVALAAAGFSKSKIARQFHIDRSSVGRILAGAGARDGETLVTLAPLAPLLAQIDQYDPETIRKLQAGLPATYTVAAATHAAESIKRAQTDPGVAAKSMFASKMAAEAGRLVGPAGENPGAQMLAFIRSFHVQVGPANAGSPASVPAVLEVRAVSDGEEPDAPA